MRNGNMFWGLVLLVLGGLFLMQAMGLLNDVFGWFWPFFLIIAGIWIITRRYTSRDTSKGINGETFSIDLLGASRADVTLDHGAGRVAFSGGAPTGVAIMGTQATGLDVHSERNGDGLQVGLQAGPTFLPFLGPDEGQWRFQLTQEVPVSIKVDAGASSLDFDLRQVKLVFLGVETGASAVNIRLPENSGQSLVSIESGAAAIDISVPADVAARIRVEQGASSLTVDQARFPLISDAGGIYQSAGYDTATNRVDINLTGGANSGVVH